MPKITKLHSTGKAKTLQKSTKPDGSDQREPEESLREFQLQLLWCIQKLERSIGEKKGNDRQLQEMWKALTVLKNNNQPIIRKRQLMRKHLGDYRAKMAAEEKSLVKMASKIKIADNPVQPKATFLRKSAFLSTGDSTFKFNFNVPHGKIDNKALEDSENCELNKVIDKTENIDLTADDNTDTLENVIDEKLTTDSTKGEGDNFNKCEFSLSASDFKFNFDVDSK